MDILAMAQASQLIDLLKMLAAIGFGGGAMSLLTSAIAEASWPARAKEATAFLTCLVGSFVFCLIAGLDATNLVVIVPAMIVACHLFYVRWFKPTGIASWIETLFLTSSGGAFPLLRPAGWGDLVPHRRLVTRFEGRAFDHAALGAGSEHGAHSRDSRGAEAYDVAPRLKGRFQLMIEWNCVASCS